MKLGRMALKEGISMIQPDAMDAAMISRQLAVDSSDGIMNKTEYLDFMLRTAICDWSFSCLNIQGPFLEVCFRENPRQKHEAVYPITGHDEVKWCASKRIVLHSRCTQNPTGKAVIPRCLDNAFSNSKSTYLFVLALLVRKGFSRR